MSSESVSEIPSAAIPAPRESAEQRPAAAAAQAKPARSGHRYDIDLLRFICACAVIMGHVGGEFMAEVGKSPENGRAAYWTGIFLDSATSWAVPTYFAIAGWAVMVGAPPPVP